ncbi:MAG: hypothetical protein IIC85_01845 [Chloroflexi bacterium]|nr:hypothetical protein [Chloroflexota bacterium]
MPARIRWGQARAVLSPSGWVPKRSAASVAAVLFIGANRVFPLAVGAAYRPG